MDQVVTLRPAPPPSHAFQRAELYQIMGVYGRMVALGIAKDYAIDHLGDRAVVSIFRRAAETPMYRVEKCPRDAKRQGAYSVVGMDGRILKRGHELAQVLKVLERKLIKAVD
ncbi:MAG: DUF2794 domain-containing protein [Pseudomonadota bacterium]